MSLNEYESTVRTLGNLQLEGKMSAAQVKAATDFLKMNLSVEDRAVRNAQEQAMAGLKQENVIAQIDARTSARIREENAKAQRERDKINWQEGREVLKAKQQQVEARKVIRVVTNKMEGVPAYVKTREALMPTVREVYPIAAAQLDARQEIALNAGADKIYDDWLAKYANLGLEPPTREESRTMYRENKDLHEYLRKDFAGKAKAFTVEAENRLAYDAGMNTLEKAGVDALKRRQALSGAPGAPPQSATEITEGMVANALKGEGKMSGTKKAGIAAALIGAGYLASKMFGGGQDKQPVPPELQMALMQQYLGKSGARGPDENVTTGRELMNMSRTLNMIELLQGMQGMQQDQSVDVARLM